MSDLAWFLLFVLASNLFVGAALFWLALMVGRMAKANLDMANSFKQLMDKGAMIAFIRRPNSCTDCQDNERPQ